MEDVFKLIGRITVENAEANKNIDDTTKKAETAASKISRSFEKAGSFLNNAGQKITSVGTVMTATLTTGIAGLVAQGIKYNAEMETFQMNLTTLLGSSDKAAKLLSDLEEMAATTPFETTDLISATQTMIGFGISAQDSQKYLEILGNIAMGDSEKLKGLSLAFAQVQSTGKLTGQDLLQMINQGFNPLYYLSEMTGKSMATLKEEMSDGAISAEMVGDAFEYATQKGQPFYNAMENGSKTVNGRISTLKDNFNIMLGTLTESLLPIFEKVVDKLIELTEKFSNLSDEQKENILKWGAIVAAIGPALIVFGKLTSGVGTVVSAIGKLSSLSSVSTAINGFVGACGGAGAALGAVAAVVVALVGVFVFLKRHWDKVTETFKNFAENTGLAEKFEEIKSKVQPLMEKFKELGDLFEVIGGALIASLQPAIATLAGVFNGVVSAIGPLMDWLGGLLDVLSGLGTFIKSVFTGDWQAASDALKKIWNGLITMFKSNIKAMTSFFKGFFEGIVGWWKGLFDSIGVTEFFNKVITAIKDWWASVVSWWQGVWAGVTGFFSSIGPWFDTNVIQPIANFFTGLWTKIQEIWDNICTAISLAIQFIANMFSAAFQIITIPFMFIWENCKQYVFMAWEWIKEKINTAVEAVRSVITTVFNAISSFISTIWENVKSVTSTVWNAIVNFVTPIINNIKNTVTTVFNAIKTTITNIWNNIKTVTSTVWNAIKTAIETVINTVKSVITTVFNTIKTTVTNIWNNIKTTTSNVWNNIKSSVSNVINNMKSTISNVFNTVKSNVTTVWNNIKDAIWKPISEAWTKVQEFIDKIKSGLSNLSVHIKTPHFKFSGSMNPMEWKDKGVPTISVEWYKKAMDNPMILRQPTAFGMSPNGSIRAGGEAGDEVVSGADTLMNMISNAVSNNNASLIDRLQAIIEILIEYLPVLAQMQVVLETGVLVGEMAPAMDEELGKIKDRKGRGR